jgi:hypothetical protein
VKRLRAADARPSANSRTGGVFSVDRRDVTHPPRIFDRVGWVVALAMSVGAVERRSGDRGGYDTRSP